MSTSRRHPTSPYLLRRLRSYEEARADRHAPREDGAADGQRDRHPRDAEPDRRNE